MNSLRRQFAHLRSVNRFRAAIDAIAAREDFRVRGLHQFIDRNATFFVELDADVLEKSRLFLLSDCLDNHIARDFKNLIRVAGSLASQSRDRAVFIRQNFNRRGLPDKFNAVFFR